MRTKLLACAAAAALAASLFATAASAGTLTYTDYSVIGDSTIYITAPSSLASNGADAGLIQLTVGAKTVDAWCVDIYHWLLGGQETYNVGSLTNDSATPPNTLTSAQIGEIGAL